MMVIPAEAGIQYEQALRPLDAGLRRHDDKELSFYELRHSLLRRNDVVEIGIWIRVSFIELPLHSRS